MLDFIINLEPGYVYPVLFLGHIFLGGFILIPALYLAIEQELSLFILFIVIVTSSMLNDSFWYLIGNNINRERVYSLRFVKNRMKEAKNFSAFYDEHGVWAVFFTKFIYGTRIASQILAGAHKIGFIRFLSATGAGTAVWFVIMYFLITLLDRGVSSTAAVAFRIQIIFLIMTAILILFYWFTGKYLRKRIMRSKKRNTP